MDKIRKILEKESLDGQDVDFLMANKELLTEKDLQRLGLAPISPIMDVKELVIENVPVTNVIDTVAVTPRKRGRPAKVKL